MRDPLFAYEPLISLGTFAGVFVAMAIWELFTPRRPQAIGRNWRWPNNLGVLAAAVLIFEVLLNATSMFNHSNVRIAPQIDRILRWFVVTPDMHRVHHSILRRETNSNFGFNLTWWDRLLGTYRAQPAAGHDAMTIGIEQFRDARELGLDRMLLQPFRGEAGSYPLGMREADQ